MRIGVDFDNTIVCYDTIFHRVSSERGLIPPDLPTTKSDVRNYLRRADLEEAWIEIQGHVYGARMREAEPFPGVLEFFAACRLAGIDAFIISHKTRTPFAGTSHDLHTAAREWLGLEGFFDPAGIGLSPEHVFFELTRAGKLDRIANLGCTHFIDDLPEFLAEPGFPSGVQRILFDPHRLYGRDERFPRLESWEAALQLVPLPLVEGGR